MKYPILLLLIILASCSKPKKDFQQVHSIEKDTLKYQETQILSITGDFDGDGKQDKISQFIVDSTGKRVDKIIDFQFYDIFDVAKYFDKHNLHVQIDLNKKSTKIDAGYSCGLLCLINIGDNNNDKKDEIAIVPDRMDYSRHNYCYIYSLCQNGWNEILSFNVHEDAFDYTGDEPPIFTTIPGALELRNKKWYYLDYLEMDYKTAEEVGQMLPLIIPPCQK